MYVCYSCILNVSYVIFFIRLLVNPYHKAVTELHSCFDPSPTSQAKRKTHYGFRIFTSRFYGPWRHDFGGLEAFFHCRTVRLHVGGCGQLIGLPSSNSPVKLASNYTILSKIYPAKLWLNCYLGRIATT